MKLLGTTSLQEPSEGQASIVLGKEIKKMLKGMGWKKGSKIGVYRHGAGLFITTRGIAQKDEEPDAGEPEKEKKKAGK